MLPAVLKIRFVAIAPSTLFVLGGCHYRLDSRTVPALCTSGGTRPNAVNRVLVTRLGQTDNIKDNPRTLMLGLVNLHIYLLIYEPTSLHKQRDNGYQSLTQQRERERDRAENVAACGVEEKLQKWGNRNVLSAS